MSIIFRPNRAGQTKPIGRVQIDWTHPLADGLIFYAYDTGQGVSYIDLARGLNPQINGTPSTLNTSAPCQFGVGTLWNNSGGGSNTSGAGFYFSADAAIHALNSSPPFTFATAVTQRSAVNMNNNDVCFTRSSNNSGAPPFLNWGFQQVGSNVIGMSACVNNNGALSQTSTWSGYANNQFTSFAGVVTPTTLTFYGNGVQQAQNTGLTIADSATGDPSDAVHICGKSSGAGGSGWDGWVHYGALWNRALSQTELAALHNDPYQFLIPAEGEYPTLFTQPPSPLGRTSGWNKARSGYTIRSRQQAPARAFGPPQIDWSHPITNGLSWLYVYGDTQLAPQYVDNGDPGTASALFGAFGLGPAGPGVVGGGGPLRVDTISYLVSITAGTCANYITINSQPANGTDEQFLSFGSGGFSPLRKFSDNNFYNGWNNASDTRVVVSAASCYGAGDTFSACLTWNATRTDFYTKGVLRGSFVGAPSTASTSGAQYNVNASSNMNATLYYTLIWNRVLQPEEIRLLSDDPFCFLVGAGEEAISGPAQIIVAAPSLIGGGLIVPQPVGITKRRAGILNAAAPITVAPPAITGSTLPFMGVG